mmetsp:Transcript_24333/g.55079  ORF Transcript_24333/g.55079 Transcript_24333/m.55079 type:complete len:473 (+) Transcript_24333:69-1487(+)
MVRLAAHAVVALLVLAGSTGISAAADATSAEPAPESTTTEATTLEERTTAEATTSEEAASTSQPSSTSEEATTSESTTSEEAVTTSHPSTTSKEAATTSQPSTTSEEATTAEATTLEEAAATSQSTTSEEATTAEATTSEEAATTSQLSTTSQEATTTPQESTTSEEAATTSQASTTTEEATTTSQESTTSEEAPAKTEAKTSEDEEESTDCFENSVSFEPLDMEGTPASKEPDAVACQKRCVETEGCSYFSFWNLTTDCHLQDEYALRMEARPGYTAGPRSCDTPVSLPEGNGCMKVAELWSPVFGLPKYFPENETGKGVEGKRKAILECEKLCKSTHNCMHYTMHFPLRVCHLANKHSQALKAAGGTISGSLDCSYEADLNQASDDDINAVEDAVLGADEESSAFLSQRRAARPQGASSFLVASMVVAGAALVVAGAALSRRSAVAEDYSSLLSHSRADQLVAETEMALE